MRRLWREDAGSAVAEFSMVAGLLTVLTLSVIQLGLALHVRNTVIDAAAEGARYASLAGGDLAGGDLEAGEQRTRDLITAAIGPSYAREVAAANDDYLGYPAVTVTVTAPLPVLGLLGFSDALEVAGHAPLELVD
nr:TadE family protein [Glaciihabitans tibetensis]